MHFAGRAIAVFAATMAALLSASNATAQTADQVRDAFVKFTAAQRTLGMNESCVVLDHSEMRYADALVSELKAPLSRILGDKFKPDEIREDGRVLFEGWKSRESEPEAWQQIDFVKQMGAASVIAASLIPMPPDQCIGRSNNPVTAAQLKIAEDLATASLKPDQRGPVLDAAKSLVPMFEEGCAKK